MCSSVTLAGYVTDICGEFVDAFQMSLLYRIAEFGNGKCSGEERDLATFEEVPEVPNSQVCSYCWRTVATAASDTYTVRAMGLSARGYTSIVACQRASFAAEKASSRSFDNSKSTGLPANAT